MITIPKKDSVEYIRFTPRTESHSTTEAFK